MQKSPARATCNTIPKHAIEEGTFDINLVEDEVEVISHGNDGMQRCKLCNRCIGVVIINTLNL